MNKAAERSAARAAKAALLRAKRAPMRIMLQDDGETEYMCRKGRYCAYSGEFTCQNCGYKKGRLPLT